MYKKMLLVVGVGVVVDVDFFRVVVLVFLVRRLTDPGMLILKGLYYPFFFAFLVCFLFSFRVPKGGI
jgi:hypothetical protein